MKTKAEIFWIKFFWIIVLTAFPIVLIVSVWNSRCPKEGYIRHTWNGWLVIYNKIEGEHHGR